MKKGKVLKIVLLVILIVAALLVGGYFGVRALGKYRLESRAGEKKPMIDSETGDQQVEVVDENSVKYKGVTYTFNDQVMNFVIMGIDKSGDIQSMDAEAEIGRSDVVILVSVDHKNRKVTLFNLNRNIMTDIAIYDENGEYLRQAKAQLALAHTFGDGKEESAKLVCDAVSNLFYGLPIHGYCALNLDVIPILNEKVGGVTVTLLKDYTEVDPSYVKGAEVLLDGDMAVRYVRSRNAQEGEDNEVRMERQKQYMKGFLSKAKDAIRQNPTLALGLYQAIQPYMVTDIGADQGVYLATQAIGYTLDTELHSLQGTDVVGTPYDEFYVDETALYETILNTYYEVKD